MKKKIKGLLCLLLALSMSSALCACGNGNDKENSSSESSSAESQSVSAESSVESSAELSSASSSEESAEQIKAAVPEEWQDKGIFSDYYEKAYEKMSAMTLEQKVGQVILARYPSSDAYETAKKYYLGGYVLFWADLDEKTKDQIILQNDKYSQAHDIPMIMATDEEGGYVSRLSDHDMLDFEDFRSPREIFNEGGMDAIKDDALRKSQIMNNLRINTNLAPVCDICTGEDKFMYDRSLGQDADVTSTFVREVTKISQENGVSVTLKHFPGYGNNEDTHTGIAVDNRNMETFESTDLKPFQAGIDEGAHLVLVSHNIVNCMDPERPASLSPEVHKLLRDRMGFTGIIITDDLAMGAISEYSPDQSAVVTAFNAGNDMLCISDIEDTYDNMLAAVNDGTITTDSLDHAVMRVLAWKYAKGMIKD